MSKIEEKKQEILKNMSSIAGSIITGRLKAINEALLGLEIREHDKSKGIASDYPALALKYGQQRALLRGLTAADVLNFDITSGMGTPLSFTLPSTTRFGYELYNMAHQKIQFSDIDPVNELYITKRKIGDDVTETYIPPLSESKAYLNPNRLAKVDLLGVSGKGPYKFTSKLSPSLIKTTLSSRISETTYPATVSLMR